MKKFIKLILTACMVASLAFSVSAASYTKAGTTITIDTYAAEVFPGTVKIQLPKGTYATNTTYEVGAHYGFWANTQAGTDTAKDAWYFVGSFTLSSSEVASLASKATYVTFTPEWDFGVSSLRVSVGSGSLGHLSAAQVSTANGGSTSGTTTGGTTTPTVSGSVDLSAYYNSAKALNTYPNCRATNLEDRGTNGFYLRGYLFEYKSHNAGYNDTRNWREIIFINKDDNSAASAYRLYMNPRYITWLNSNMTATVNGQYKLTYAEYENVVNPKKVNKYVKVNGNFVESSMKAGTYYVYVRISNGSEANVYPLKDLKGELPEIKNSVYNLYKFVNSDNEQQFMITIY